MKATFWLVPTALVLAPPALAQEPDPAPPEPSAAAEVGEASKIESVDEQSKLATEKKDEPAPSKAEPAAEAKPEDHEAGEEDTYGHGMQVGIRGGFVLGYKMSFRYDNSPFCTKPDPEKAANKQQKICGFGAPPAAEVALSFAPFDSVEPYVFGRFGIGGESQTNTKPLKLFGLGARIYTNADSRFKIFVEPALAYETEGGAGNVLWNPTAANYKS